MGQYVKDPIDLATYIDEVNSAQNYGGGTVLEIHANYEAKGEDNEILATLLKADLTDPTSGDVVPTNATILSTSKLELYVGFIYDTLDDVVLFRGLYDLGEYTATYDNATATTTPAFEHPWPDDVGWWTITGASFASWLQDAVANRDRICRMFLLPSVETGAARGVRVYSDDDTGDPSRKPKLTVDFTVPAVGRVRVQATIIG